MAGITLAQAEARLTEYMAAETAVLDGQKYEMSGRSKTRADLKEIREGITHWNGLVREFAGTANGRGRSVNAARS